jgi:hypothetical protein
MKNLTFHIVGLTHNDVKGHEVEYAKEAEGRTICLVPDDANALVLAVAAYAAGAQVPLLTGDDEGAYVLAFQG